MIYLEKTNLFMNYLDLLLKFINNYQFYIINRLGDLTNELLKNKKNTSVVLR